MLEVPFVHTTQYLLECYGPGVALLWRYRRLVDRPWLAVVATTGANQNFSSRSICPSVSFPILASALQEAGKGANIQPNSEFNRLPPNKNYKRPLEETP